jgi:hypothetical protein
VVQLGSLEAFLALNLLSLAVVVQDESQVPLAIIGVDYLPVGLIVVFRHIVVDYLLGLFLEFPLLALLLPALGVVSPLDHELAVFPCLAGLLDSVSLLDGLEEGVFFVDGELVLDLEVGVVEAFGVLDECFPVGVLLQRPLVADHPEEVLGSGDGNVHPPVVVEEPQDLLLGGPDTRYYDYVFLPALVGIHCVYLHCLWLLEVLSQLAVDEVLDDPHLALVGSDDAYLPAHVVDHHLLPLQLVLGQRSVLVSVGDLSDHVLKDLQDEQSLVLV